MSRKRSPAESMPSATRQAATTLRRRTPATGIGLLPTTLNPARRRHERMALRVTSRIRSAPASPFASLCARNALPVTASRVSQSSVSTREVD